MDGHRIFYQKKKMNWRTSFFTNIMKVWLTDWLTDATGWTVTKWQPLRPSSWKSSLRLEFQSQNSQWRSEQWVAFLWHVSSTRQQDRQCTYKRNTKTRSRDHCCSDKARRITYSEWVFVDFVIRHAKRMRCIMLSSVACLALSHFLILSKKKKAGFSGEKLLNIKLCFVFLYKFWLIISHSKKNSATYYNKCTYLFTWSTH